MLASNQGEQMGYRDKRKAVCILIGGSPGSGKDIVCQQLIKKYPKIVRVLRHTTRKPRNNEKHGVDYFFHTLKEYRQLVDEGKIQGDHLFCDKRYGFEMLDVKEKRREETTTVGSFGKNAIHVKEELGKYCITIYLRASIESISRRLYEDRRGEDEDTTWWRIGTALRDAHKEIVKFDYAVNSDGDVEQTMADVEKCLKEAENTRGFRIIGFHPHKKHAH